MRLAFALTIFAVGGLTVNVGFNPPQFGLIVVCRDEDDQQRVFAQLKREGYDPRVVCV